MPCLFLAMRTGSERQIIISINTLLPMYSIDVNWLRVRPSLLCPVKASPLGDSSEGFGLSAMGNSRLRNPGPSHAKTAAARARRATGTKFNR